MRHFPKEDGTVHTEEGTLQWFGEEVGKHNAGWAVLNGDGLLLDEVGDEKITNVDVAGALHTRCFAIGLHFDGAFVVLEECRLGSAETLGRHEHFNVDGIGEVIASSDELCFGRAFGIDCFLDLQIRPPLPKEITPPV
jgi:hypothetical protein